MLPPIYSAMSGLKSFSTRIHANTNNIANSNTEGYKSTRVLLENTQPNGVKPVAEKTTAPGPPMLVETEEGQKLLEQSNVELTKEIAEMMINSNAYKVNLKSLQTSDEMMQSILNLKA